MKAVVTLNNFWEWSGGMEQYLEWAGEGTYSANFYTSEKANKIWFDYLKRVITRNNTESGIPYSEDPTIMSWQLGNEPRAYQCTNYAKWIRESTDFINDLAPKQLINVGNEGTITGCSTEAANGHKIDYVTEHCWAQNWGWYSPNGGNINFAET